MYHVHWDENYGHGPGTTAKTQPDNSSSPLPPTHPPIHPHPLTPATCVVASSRALSGCISLSNHKELRDLSLDTVRMLLLDDGANPCEHHVIDLAF